MIKQVFYTYLGTNGVITSPVHLEDIYYTRSIKLIADAGKKLTKDNETFFDDVMIPEENIGEWKEVTILK